MRTFTALILLLTIRTCLAAPLDDADLDRRIENLRKGDFIVKLLDNAGNPLPGKISYRLVRHSFLFGTAVNADLIQHGSRADVEQYGKIVSSYFNYAVEENDMKWHHMEAKRGIHDDAGAIAAWDWCHARGIPMRGHCIFWGIDQWVPGWAKQLNRDELQIAMKDRLRHVLTLFHGKIDEWDLNNEMLHGDYFARKLGFANGTAYFKWAKEIDPAVRFCVNDYGIMQGKRTAEFVQSVKDMLRDGAPIGGINDQAHFSKNVPETTKLWACLDAIGILGLPVKVTEFDIDTTDEQQQAKDTRRFYRVCFAHPAVDAIVMWGFWQGRHWRPGAALWRKDWTIKPNGEAYAKLLDEEWMTKGEADGVDGRIKFHGFYGEYEVKSQGNIARVVLTKDRKSADVKF